MIDKNELLGQGKYFGRVFLDYLCEHPDFENGRGGIKQELADEMLTIGQAEGLTEKDSLSVANVRHWRDGVHKIPFWVNHAALMLACEKGFVVTHPADAVAIVATVLKQYTSNKQVYVDGLMIYIEQKYGVTVSEQALVVVKMYLESRGMTLLSEPPSA